MESSWSWTKAGANAALIMRKLLGKYKQRERDREQEFWDSKNKSEMGTSVYIHKIIMLRSRESIRQQRQGWMLLTEKKMV